MLAESVDEMISWVELQFMRVKSGWECKICNAYLVQEESVEK